MNAATDSGRLRVVAVEIEGGNAVIQETIRSFVQTFTRDGGGLAIAPAPAALPALPAPPRRAQRAPRGTATRRQGDGNRSLAVAAQKEEPRKTHRDYIREALKSGPKNNIEIAVACRELGDERMDGAMASMTVSAMRPETERLENGKWRLAS